MNMLNYVKSSEKWWREFLTQTGYTPITTFFNDLSISDCFGEPAIRTTYCEVLEEWGTDIKYITEFVLCLNHKIWQLYKVNEPLARLYDELWRECSQYVVENFEGEDLAYYYNVID
jgi:hypothetical protein